MSDALVRIEQVDIASELPAIFKLSEALAGASGFIPAHLRTPGEIAAVVLAGRELGLQPMVSLRSLSMIKGKVVLAADVMLGLMIRSGVKVEWLADGSAAQGNIAKLKLFRPGHEPYTSAFSIEDAQRAGLASNDNYRKHQGAMLRARAVSAGARAYCPDVLSGCYVPGELEEDEAPRAKKSGGKVQPMTLDDVAGEATALGADTSFDPSTGEVDAPFVHTYKTLMEMLGETDSADLDLWAAKVKATSGLTTEEKTNLRQAMKLAKLAGGK